MKNTMKKLLCMTLVIMLLISAVPMFAAADGDEGVSTVGEVHTCTVNIYIDGTLQTGISGDRTVNTDAMIVSLLTDKMSNIGPYNCTTTVGNTTMGWGDVTTTAIGANTYVKFELTSAKYTVGLVMDGTLYTKELSGTRTYTVGNSILSTFGVQVPAGKRVARWDNLGASVTPGPGMDTADTAPFKCYLEDDSSNNNGVGGGNIDEDGGSGSNGGSGSGTLTKFKATFLNANGLEFYSESVVSNAKLTVSASTLNNGVGTKAGYEHIGWKSSTGKTQITEEVLRDTITANVTYAPIFKNLTNNTTEVPGSGVISGGSGSVSNGSGSDLHDKVTGLQDVILHVYLNNNFNSEHKHYTITDIAKDGTLSLKGDVKDFLKKYYTAKTSDGIGYDGMYVTDAYFGVKYLSDEKYEVLGNDADANGNTTLDKMRSAGVVHLNVMLTNASAKSSATADSSNYKTGDTIFVPVMAMGLTGTLLAAAYIFGKKRFAR